MYTFFSSKLVTRIHPFGAVVIEVGSDKRVIVLPVKRPSKVNC